VLESVHRLKSAVLGNERNVWVTPPLDPATCSQLTVFLDAEMYRDNVHAAAICETARREGAIPDSWFVWISSESIEARWKECPCHPPFARFIVDEFLPWLASTHPDTRRATWRTLVGLSYTGLAAAYVAHERPGVFARVIAQSGSFWWHDAWLCNHVTRQGAQDVAFWLEVGARETQTNLKHQPDVVQAMSQIAGVQRMRDALVAQGYEVKYVETADGAHDTSAWARSLPSALRWAAGSASLK